MIDKERIERLIYEFLEAIGENPEREGLKETPNRVARMCEEMFSGISENSQNHIKLFNDESKSDKIILVKDIPFCSVCEHHLLPFLGVVHVAYIPKNGNIIGLSKISRIVDCYAKKPQVQECLTEELANFFSCEFETLASAVIIEAEHMCMTIRGVKSRGSKTKTCVLKGLFETDSEKKRELYALL